MDKIRIGDNSEFYVIKSLKRINNHVIRLEFKDLIPTSYGDINIFTPGDIKSATLSGYNTIYRDEGNVVFLSDDESVYIQENAPEVLPTDPYIPTEEELFESAKASKRNEINKACEAAIVSGIDVILADGTTEHFDLKVTDQLNLFGKQLQVAQGIEQIEYHTDTEPVTNCKYYTNADMAKIINAAMAHVSYHQTYCISMKYWLESCSTTEEVNSIYYGVVIPKEYQSDVLKSYLAEM